MICHRCLYRASAHRVPSLLSRTLTTTASPSSPATSNPASVSFPSAAQPFSTPLTPKVNVDSLGTNVKPKSKVNIPVSSAPAGTVLKGLNFLKGREDPLALPEEEYPEWLWKCLDTEKKGDEDESFEGDEFSKSKKQRRAAAKRKLKHEQAMLASGETEAYAPKIPLQRQTIDLPSNEDGTLTGALEAAEKREEVRKAMRGERRKNIKEANFLKGFK